MEKKKKFFAGIIICAVVMYSLYLIISDGIKADSLRHFALILSSGCAMLSNLFSKQDEMPLPIEVEEDEAYILAKDRVNIGSKISNVGGMMVIIPLVVLMITKHLEGFLATIFVISFFGGILILIIGAILVFLGSNYKVEIPAELVPEPQDEGLMSKICSVIGMLSAVAWVILTLIR